MLRNLTLAVVVSLLAASPAPAGDLVLNDGGIVFADGSVQTTAGGLRGFYLTKTTFSGASPLLACDPGFHMASIWELAALASLRYDTVRGVRPSDGGEGPPALLAGWIRTGRGISGSAVSGLGNCNTWTTNTSTLFGTAVRLEANGSFGSFVPGTPWAIETSSCDTLLRAWCIAD